MSKDGDQRKESEQCRSGAQDGKVGPLPLRLYAQMSTDLMKGHFHRPSQHKPLQDSLGTSLLISAQQRLRIELSLWVPNKHPTDRHRGQSVVIPDSRFAGQFDRACGPAIPGHSETLPDSARIGESLRQGWLTRSLLTGTPIGSWVAHRSRLIESGVQAQTGNHGDRLDHPGCTGEQFKHRVATVGDDHQLVLRQPPTQLPDHLSSPIGELFVAATMLLIVALRGGQHGEKGQGPDPLGPRNRSQQHHRDPSQPARFDKEFFAGAYWVTIDAFSRYLGSPTPFNRLVDAHHNGSILRYKELDQQAQEEATEGSAGPFSSVEHAVIVLELSFLMQTHHAQDGCHRSFSWSQDRSDQEHFGPLPDPLAKRFFKVAQHVYNPFRQMEHLSSLFAIRFE